ncbi:TetR/AcrR family transcriptional regulator [Leptospira yasudae]|nr:TetR/AcrR family transcriptional regulator [Leptospira yasudae]TGM00431.1 TetR/AcrR family transcriptional regulator [Leptospira yasudae]
MGEKGTASKERMIKAMALSLETKGYNGTGLNDIVESSGAPKGSIYFHFPGGKEDLAAEAITVSGREMGSMLLSLLLSSKSPSNAVLAIFKSLENKLVETNYTQGCPVATTASETVVEGNPVNEACRNIFSEWNQGLESYFVRMGWEKKFASILSTSILCLLEGAILLSRTHQDPEPLRSAAKTAKLLVQQGEKNR